MQILIIRMLYTFLTLFVLTFLMTLIGLGCVWWGDDSSKYVHLDKLMGCLVFEVVGIIILFVRKGLRYLPETHVNKTQEDTMKFMEDFISSGTSATIFSNRVSWLASNQNLISILNKKLISGIKIEVITPNSVNQELKEKLSGVCYYNTKSDEAPKARFTLINGDRSGAERLAIARGIHPNHEITVFDNDSGPQMIAMAKDIIRVSKAKEVGSAD